MRTAEALAIIDETAYRAFKVPGANDQARAALKHLSDIGVERDRLEIFWKSLFVADPVGRDQNASAAKNRIHLLLLGKGWQA